MVSSDLLHDDIHPIVHDAVNMYFTNWRLLKTDFISLASQ